MLQSRVPNTHILLFDLDGTLVDSTELIVEAFHRVWESHFSYRPERAALVATIGMLIDRAMHHLLQEGTQEARLPAMNSREKEALVRSLLDEYRDVYVGMHDAWIRPFPGIVEALETLRHRGYRLGVVTSKRRVGADRSLGFFDLHQRLDLVVAAEDTSEHKPHPAPVLRGVELLGGTPAASAYIGDSTHDMIAGRRAGVLTIAALWGPFDPLTLEEHQPDHLLESPSDLLTLFPERMGT